MGEKKKSNANTTALIGAAFLMATSAIGPGFRHRLQPLPVSMALFSHWQSSVPFFWMLQPS